jgi:hypothetical protein
MEPSMLFDYDVDMTGLNTPNDIDILSFTMDTFIDALVDVTSWRHEFAHLINARPNVYEKYNSIMMELFHMPMLPREESGVHVMEAYALRKLLNMGNYLLILPMAKEAKKNKPRNEERGSSCQELARNLHWLGVTRKQSLEQGLQGGVPAENDKHKGRHWRQIYGVPFDLFVLLSDNFEAWLGAKDQHTYLKHALPFKLRAVACFRQFRLGGLLRQHHEGCSLSITVFHKFSFSFLVWLWDIWGDNNKLID